MLAKLRAECSFTFEVTGDFPFSGGRLIPLISDYGNCMTVVLLSGYGAVFIDEICDVCSIHFAVIADIRFSTWQLPPPCFR
jgi:hypothetical protein